MSSLQFYHGTIEKDHFKEFTVVVDVPRKEDLRLEVWKLMGDTIKTVDIPVGYVRVHPKEQYNKKIGRIEALSRCKTRPFVLTNIQVVENKKLIYLYNDEVAIVLEVKEGRDKVFLIDAGI